MNKDEFTEGRRGIFDILNGDGACVGKGVPCIVARSGIHGDIYLMQDHCAGSVPPNYLKLQEQYKNKYFWWCARIDEGRDARLVCWDDAACYIPILPPGAHDERMLLLCT